MQFISIQEIIDIVVMTLFVGYIFSGYLGRFRTITTDPLKAIKQQFLGVNIEDLKFAALVTAPAIVLHEFGHKIAAISFGLQATFNAAYFWLIIGVALKLIGSSFIFFVPAYIQIIGSSSHLQSSIIAFAGPGTNLVLWLASYFALKQKLLPRKYLPVLFLTARINMLLFIFNMLPFYFFDGYKVFSGLYQALF